MLKRRGIPWPRHPNGVLDLETDTFREMSKAYPQLSPLHELRILQGKTRLSDLVVGDDGRNRSLLSPFRSRTGRNQPSNSKFVFGLSVWRRGLILAPPGHCVIYLDWEQQEFGIAAALSGDHAMMQAYRSGDCYLHFPKLAGQVPPDGLANDYRAEREMAKRCILGVQYGMGYKSLAARIGKPPIYGQQLLADHHRAFPDFWRWSQRVVDSAMLDNKLHTIFGWHIWIGRERPNVRTLQNFLMQAGGADVLRLACCLMVERGLELCAPIHDAVLLVSRSD
jgi:hypothetical protein